MEYMTPQEAAKYLRVSTKTLRRWVLDGSLKAYKKGKVVRYARTDLDKVLK